MAQPKYVNSTFLEPWNGQLKMCNSRADCSTNDTLLGLFSAFCYPLQGYPVPQGFRGYCRCATWTFRGGRHCFDLSPASLFFFTADAVPQTLVCCILLVLLFKIWRINLRKKKNKCSIDMVILCCCSIATISLILDIPALYIKIMLRGEGQAFVSLKDTMLVVSIGVLAQVPVVSNFVSYMLLSIKFLAFQRRLQSANNSEETETLLCDPVLAGILVFGITGSAAFLFGTTLGRPDIPIIVSIVILAASTVYFVTAVHRMLRLVKNPVEPNLNEAQLFVKSWESVFVKATLRLVTLSLIAIVVMIVAVVAFTLPAPVDDDIFHFEYFGQMTTRMGFYLPTLAVLTFLVTQGTTRPCDFSTTSIRETRSNTKPSRTQQTSRFCSNFHQPSTYPSNLQHIHENRDIRGTVNDNYAGVVQEHTTSTAVPIERQQEVGNLNCTNEEAKQNVVTIC